MYGMEPLREAAAVCIAPCSRLQSRRPRTQIGPLISFEKKRPAAECASASSLKSDDDRLGQLELGIRSRGTHFGETSAKMSLEIDD